MHCVVSCGERAITERKKFVKMLIIFNLKCIIVADMSGI